MEIIEVRRRKGSAAGYVLVYGGEHVVRVKEQFSNRLISKQWAKYVVVIPTKEESLCYWSTYAGQ